MSLSIIILSILVLYFASLIDEVKTIPDLFFKIILILLPIIMFITTINAERCRRNKFLVENSIMEYKADPITGKISLEWVEK